MKNSYDIACDSLNRLTFYSAKDEPAVLEACKHHSVRPEILAALLYRQLPRFKDADLSFKQQDFWFSVAEALVADWDSLIDTILIINRVIQELKRTKFRE